MKVSLRYGRARSESERVSQAFNSREAPRLPATCLRSPRRWHGGPTWTPTDGILLVRHLAADGSRRIVTNDRTPPEGFAIEYDLGIVHRHAHPGTQRLIARGDAYFRTPFEGALAAGYRALGYVQQTSLPLLDCLELRLDPETGQQVLVAGPSDPLSHSTVPQSTLGFIESYPLNPRGVIDERIMWHLLTLLREPDVGRWRHRYRAAASRREGEVALGGVWDIARPESTALRRTIDGWLETEDCPLPRRKPTFAARLRWAASPLNWRSTRLEGRAVRAAARRAGRLARGYGNASPPTADEGATLLGYVRRSPAPNWTPLFSALHPALNDQYLTRSELEASDLGYDIIGVLGYVADSCADRTLDRMPAQVEWASRFGVGRRYVEEPKRTPSQP